MQSPVKSMGSASVSVFVMIQNMYGKWAEFKAMFKTFNIKETSSFTDFSEVSGLVNGMQNLSSLGQ